MAILADLGDPANSVMAVVVCIGIVPCVRQSPTASFSLRVNRRPVLVRGPIDQKDAACLRQSTGLDQFRGNLEWKDDRTREMLVVCVRRWGA